MAKVSDLINFCKKVTKKCKCIYLFYLFIYYFFNVDNYRKILFTIKIAVKC